MKSEETAALARERCTHPKCKNEARYLRRLFVLPMGYSVEKDPQSATVILPGEFCEDHFDASPRDLMEARHVDMITTWFAEHQDRRPDFRSIVLQRVDNESAEYRMIMRSLGPQS